MELVTAAIILSVIAIMLSVVNITLWIAFHIKQKVSENSTHAVPMPTNGFGEDNLADLAGEIFKGADVFGDYSYEKPSKTNPEKIHPQELV